MSIMDKPEGLCKRCNKRPATLWWNLILDLLPYLSEAEK